MKLHWRAWNSEAVRVGTEQLRKVQQPVQSRADQKAMMAAQAEAKPRRGRPPHSSN